MGKCIVITGGAGVLCAAFARALAVDGHRIVLLNRTLEKGRRVAADIVKNGGTACAYRADVTSLSDLQNAHRQILAETGPCDILINGAGGNHPSCTTTEETADRTDAHRACRPGKKTFFTLSQQGFEQVFGLNMIGTVLPTQVFGSDMVGRKGCSIINVSSMAAIRPLTKTPAYGAAKAAVSNFTAWLAVYLAAQGIRVNAIAPGFFITEQNRHLLFEENGEAAPRTGKILGSTPMARFGQPEELLGTLRWLIDERASGFVTGITVPVDGGFSAYSGV